ncbi:MAG TPA: hypothetical protein VHK67_03505 [Rhabdochlamydiaceae bacterium]|nr:hypothetical protein [Rhabdochlamydiaceae bacterium]
MATVHTTSYREKRHWLQRNWWVIAFASLCGVLYLHGVRQKNTAYFEMTARLQGLEAEKALALADQEELLLQIQSQSDPAFVEMVLKRNLGLVPEGQTKVYFHQ